MDAVCAFVVAALLWVAPAFAGWVPEFSEDFERWDVNNFSGNGGWQSGYDRDTWSTRDSSGVYARTDDEGGTWGSGDALDNHLVQTDRTWSDFQMVVDTYQDDNDAIGVVFRFVDAENFYLFVMVGSPSAGNPAVLPNAGDGDPDLSSLFAASVLYRVQDGNATLLGNSFLSYVRGSWRSIRITVEGSEFQAQYDADDDGAYESSEAWLIVEDSGIPEGSVGFYCYNNGGNSNACRFDNLVVSGLDADGDGQSVATGDCADDDATRFRGAEESCDELDEDCDGVIDDNAVDARLWYVDADGDGFGVAGSTTRACARPSGYAANSGDCNDASAGVFPGAAEVPDDGIDQDCVGGDDVTEDPSGDTGDSSVDPDPGDTDAVVTDSDSDASADETDGPVDSDASGPEDSDVAAGGEDRVWAGVPESIPPGEGCRCVVGRPSGALSAWGIGGLTLWMRRRRRDERSLRRGWSGRW